MILLFCLGLIFVHTATSASISATTAAPGCTITALNTNGIEDWPIFTQNYQFIYAPKTSEHGEISIPVGKSIEISCPGSTAKGIPNKETNNATCVLGSKYKINNVAYDLLNVNLHCTAEPKNDARLTGKLCENKGKEIKIGFNLPGSKYIQQIRLCLNLTTQLSLYSHYIVTGSISKHDKVDTTGTEFAEDSFYKFKMKDLYTNQRKTVNGLLGYPPGDMTYIKSDEQFQLSRGHFAARMEFAYGYQQKATYHYINTAPQWTIFNNGNWQTLEEKVIAYAGQLSKDLEIYTGTFGISTLPHKNDNKRIPLYLYVNGKQKAIPIPELFWKAIYEPTSQKAVVVFGVNNPYYESEAAIKEAKSIICPDVLPKLTRWLKFKKEHDIKQGYMYACEFAEAKKKISYLPAWTVKGLLI